MSNTNSNVYPFIYYIPVGLDLCCDPQIHQVLSCLHIFYYLSHLPATFCPLMFAWLAYPIYLDISQNFTSV